jgi:ribA/ribD-fused uncharacterized protein
MRSREELSAAHQQGASFEYLFFWGHRRPPDGKVTKSCLSQWFEAPFEQGGATFPTAEHFMMASKASLFGDEKSLEAILGVADPGKAKALGRKVRGFDEAVWVARRWAIVVEANFLKFAQNGPLREFLLATGDSVLVEASPYDRIWGIGLGADSEAAKDPTRWRGSNLLGFALMEVRDGLRRGA